MVYSQKTSEALTCIQILLYCCPMIIKHVHCATRISKNRTERFVHSFKKKTFHYSDILFSAQLKCLWQQLQPPVFVGLMPQSYIWIFWGSPAILLKLRQTLVVGWSHCRMVKPPWIYSVACLWPWRLFCLASLPLSSDWCLTLWNIPSSALKTSEISLIELLVKLVTKTLFLRLLSFIRPVLDVPNFLHFGIMVTFSNLLNKKEKVGGSSLDGRLVAVGLDLTWF